MIFGNIILQEDSNNSYEYDVKKVKNGYVIKDGKGNILSKLNYYDYKIKNFDWILLANIETDPTYRGKGLATKLINTVYDDITKNNPNKGLYLFVRQSNNNAIKLYNKLKFKKIKEYEIDGNSYDIMVRGNAHINQFNNMKFT